MRLLVYTQSVDKNDPILGFFHRWIEEIATHFEVVHVICLRKGIYDLPKNVSVYSLGKETGESQLKYIVKFYQYLYQLRNQYDRVFVHMNPHYILLGGIYWRIMKIPIFFWRNHARMNIMTRIAAPLSRKVFYTSPFACLSRYSHAIQMPVGIDVHTFTPQSVNPSTKTKVLFLGRLSPVKRVELFIEAGALLPPEYEMHIYGSDPTKEKKYGLMLETMATKNIVFHGSIKNDDTPEIYRTHDIYVNLTPVGSMDKTVFEAAACKTQVIATNTSFSQVLPAISILHEPTKEALAERIVAINALAASVKEQNLNAARDKVIQEHSLQKLGSMLYLHITQ